MSAETLRRAAALMRERAEAAYDWTVDNDNHLAIPFLKWRVAEPPSRYYQREYETAAYDDGTTVHMGAWHPAVALAVADLLDTIEKDVGTSSLAYHAAADFARAYLGDPA